MDRRRFGLSVLGLGLAVPGASCTQNPQRAAVPNRPPLANSPAEKKVLEVLDQMVASDALYRSVPAEVGRMLRLFTESSGARNVVEIGTSTGYSGLWLCLALQNTQGRLTTFEIDEERAAQARKHFEQAGVHGMVEIVLGNAHENVKRLTEQIDLIFIDADKEGYAAYLKALRRLLRPGGIIAADNVAMAPDYIEAITTNPELETMFFGRFSVTLKKA
jgi:caffeoyl-CoA O-methyltransferase